MTERNLGDDGSRRSSGELVAEIYEQSPELKQSTMDIVTEAALPFAIIVPPGALLVGAIMKNAPAIIAASAIMGLTVAASIPSVIRDFRSNREIKRSRCMI